MKSEEDFRIGMKRKIVVEYLKEKKMKERKMYLKRNGLRQTGEDGTTKRGEKKT